MTETIRARDLREGDQIIECAAEFDTADGMAVIVTRAEVSRDDRLVGLFQFSAHAEVVICRENR